MILDGLLTMLQALFGWLFIVILQMLLRIVDILEKLFDVFAGTEPVYYQGEPNYLFNLFFSNNAINNLFWAMALIAIILSFGFCIIAVARKVTDVSGTTKQTLGQIISNFIRSLLVILMLNICIIIAINVTSVIFERINFSLENAGIVDLNQERKYTDEEFATMARILATMGNYAANPSAESRYNVNACFNAIRGEMITLYEAKCFDYDFPVVQTGKHTWQSALAQVAKSANLKEDLQLDTYYPTVQDAVILCFEQLKTNSNFKPQETAVLTSGIVSSMSTAKMIFLTASMGAEENKQFENGNFEDALRRSYLNGEKDYLDFSDVYEDFSITKINYAVGLIVAFAMILFLGKIILMFVVRMLNLLLLYIVSPLFASTMSMDEGSRFQNWTQSFIMQLLGAYGGVIMMRLYLLILPLVISSEFQFFEPGTLASRYNIYGQLAIVLGGAWAVSRASVLISGALTGNASSALQDADSVFGHTISDMVGTGRIHKELSRWRNNKDRTKSTQKANEKTQMSTGESVKAMKQLTNAITGSRSSNRGELTSELSSELPSEKRNREDGGGSNLAFEKMRQNAGLDGNVGDRSYVDDADREDSKVSKMRASMGFAAPRRNSYEETPDSFSLDSLPDLGKLKGIQGKEKNPIGGDGFNKKTTNTNVNSPNDNKKRNSITNTGKRVSLDDTEIKKTMGSENSNKGTATGNESLNKPTVSGGIINNTTVPEGSQGGNVNRDTSSIEKQGADNTNGTNSTNKEVVPKGNVGGTPPQTVSTDGGSVKRDTTTRDSQGGNMVNPTNPAKSTNSANTTNTTNKETVPKGNVGGTPSQTVSTDSGSVKRDTTTRDSQGGNMVNPTNTTNKETVPKGNVGGTPPQTVSTDSGSVKRDITTRDSQGGNMVNPTNSTNSANSTNSTNTTNTTNKETVPKGNVGGTPPQTVSTDSGSVKRDTTTRDSQGGNMVNPTNPAKSTNSANPTNTTNKETVPKGNVGGTPPQTVSTDGGSVKRDTTTRDSQGGNMVNPTNPAKSTNSTNTTNTTNTTNKETVPKGNVGGTPPQAVSTDGGRIKRDTTNRGVQDDNTALRSSEERLKQNTQMHDNLRERVKDRNKNQNKDQS